MDQAVVDGTMGAEGCWSYVMVHGLQWTAVANWDGGGTAILNWDTSAIVDGMDQERLRQGCAVLVIQFFRPEGNG